MSILKQAVNKGTKVKIAPYAIDTEKTLANIAECVILQQLTYNAQHKIQFTPYYKHNLKKYLKLANIELQKAELKEYDNLFDMEETATVQLYGATEKMIKLISELGIIEHDNIYNVLLAYQKDRSSMEGIVNKINKHK